ncbi:MAG: zinc metalloprotease [Candidatus Helarchaeales archaeon]
MGKIQFSTEEILHYITATALLTIAFSISFGYYWFGSIFRVMEQYNYNFLRFFNKNSYVLTNILFYSFLFVVISFLGHETSHKIVAQHYDAWAEFRASFFDLFMCLIFAVLIGIIFAAPGAVYISEDLKNDQIGKTALAGPMFNFIISMIVLPFFMFYLIFPSLFAIHVPKIFLFYLIYMNLILATFNLIPLGEFDGAKILRWNKNVYFAFLGVTLLFLIPFLMIYFVIPMYMLLFP